MFMVLAFCVLNFVFLFIFLIGLSFFKPFFCCVICFWIICFESVFAMIVVLFFCFVFLISFFRFLFGLFFFCVFICYVVLFNSLFIFSSYAYFCFWYGYCFG